MEHKTHQTAHQQGKSVKNILYVWDGISQNQNRATNKMGGFVVEEMGKLNIFLVQNKGKGPPGRQRSPGYYADHPPARPGWSDDGHPPDRCEPLNCLSSETKRRLIRNNFNTEYQIDDNNKYNSLMIKFLLS